MVKTPKTDAGADVRERRERAGLTQRELADRIGVQQHTISEIETGASARPSRPMLLAIERALCGAQKGRRT